VSKFSPFGTSLLGFVGPSTYDAAGETTNIIEQAASGAPIAFFKFGFDNAARVKWELAAPVPHTNAATSRMMTFDDDNRLATFNSGNITNDSDGNMLWGPLTNDTFATFTFDPRNRLVRTTSTSSLDYSYDALGNRLAITNGTNITRFIVNPNAKLRLN
jgi:YD repeat-containing protein